MGRRIRAGIDARGFSRGRGSDPGGRGVSAGYFYGECSGKTLDDFRARLRFFETGGVRIPYLAPDDLIFLKQNSWRDKDKKDILAMREIMKAREKAAE